MDSFDWDAMPIIRTASSFDPIDVISSWKISQRQEAATKLVADSVSAKSGTVPNDNFTKNCSPFSLAQNYNPLEVCGVMAEFSSNNLNKVITGPLESPNCLLSVTGASNKDASVEDDGISRIFSGDSESLWNFNNRNNAVSSGESDNQEEIPVRSAEAKRYGTKRSHDHERDLFARGFDFKLISENQPKSKKPKPEKNCTSSSNINFHQATSSTSSIEEPDSEAITQMKEMIYRATLVRPVSFNPEVVKKPKRKNVRISTDPQTVAARQRRERISEKIRILQKLVPGGSKMDTASMLDEAANYLKFLRTQVKELEAFGHKPDPFLTYNLSSLPSIPFNHYPFSLQQFFPLNPIHRMNS